MVTIGLALSVALTLLAVTIVLSLVRVVRGPSLPDRVIALDLLISVAIAMTVVYAMVTDQPVFIDVATALALISFLGTVAFARYIDLRR
ncbi:MAG: cation:proton antiporter [Chloroflexi bacterium]|nr:MAG: cation:proton antiporter [Chloroflexota bacterium]